MFREFQVSGDWFLDRNVVERCRDKATTNQFGEITNFEISVDVIHHKVSEQVDMTSKWSGHVLGTVFGSLDVP